MKPGRRRRLAGRIALAAVLPLTAVVPLLPARGAAAQDAPPDVVLIVTDDQRWDTLWAMPVVGSELVGRGVTFPDAFVVNPICCPSRASILTGNYSHTTSVYRQSPPFGRYEWFDDRSTLATWLHDAGYTTGLVGKYLDGYQHAAVTGVVPRGWDRWVAFVHAAYSGYGLSVDGDVRSVGASPGDYSTDVLAEEAVAFLEDAEGPLFLLFAPAAPHAPAVPAPGDEGAFGDLEPARPPSFDEADVSDKPGWVRALPRLDAARRAEIDAFRRDQYRSLLGVDRAIGRILAALERTGRLENTLLILTSDNGIQHGEHRWTKKEAPYEESIRVPMVVRWDAAGWTVRREPDALALNIDLAPTIADAAGVPAPETDGRSLLDVLEGASGAGLRADFLIEHLEGGNPVPTYCAVRSRSWKYVRYAPGDEELYDLRADPFELTNLAGVAGARSTLERLRERLRGLCRPAPPGLLGGGADRVALVLALLVVLLAAEALATLRSRPTSGPADRVAG